MKKKSDKERLFEVMGRLDKTFKPKLNEEVEDYEEPSDPEEGHDEYLKQSNQLKSFDDDSVLNEENRPLHQIAREIYQDWKSISPHARPYLEAMSTLNSVDDNYGFDSGKSIVAYFLSNAGTWKGEKAREIKKELKKMIGLRESEEEITVEPQEHGEEGPNYKAKLEHVVDHAQKIYEGLPEGEIPSWVQDKITIADDYLDAIYSWMHSEEEEEEGEIEGAEREMDDEELENSEEI